MPFDPFADFRLNGHSVIITGGAQNIGAGIARTLSGAAGDQPLPGRPTSTHQRKWCSLRKGMPEVTCPPAPWRAPCPAHTSVTEAAPDRRLA